MIKYETMTALGFNVENTITKDTSPHHRPPRSLRPRRSDIQQAGLVSKDLWTEDWQPQVLDAMENTPTITPSKVSAERSLCAATEDSAMAKLSRSSAVKVMVRRECKGQ